MTLPAEQLEDTSRIVTQFTCKSIEKKMDDEGQEFGYFDGYASTFGNIDRSEDIIAKGAFQKSLSQGRKIKLCWQHDMRSPIGSFTEIKEDEKGLFVKARINLGTSLGREAYALLKAGDLDSMSIGFVTKKSSYDKSTNLRTIEEADLWEVSIVTEPANPMAVVTAVKSIEQADTLADIEDILRSKGFSKKQSRVVIGKIKAISRCDAEGQQQSGVNDAADNLDTQKLIQELADLKNCLLKKLT